MLGITWIREVRFHWGMGGMSFYYGDILMEENGGVLTWGLLDFYWGEVR